MLRLLTAGESHGQGLVGIIEGLPSGVKIEPGLINHDLFRRQQGYGRGERMKIERDRVEILSGLVKGKTIGAPLALWIENRDWANWKDKPRRRKTVPRPGHADLAGLLKYGLDDIQSVIERSSARETAIRVAIGSVVKQFLRSFGMEFIGHVIEIGGITLAESDYSLTDIRKMRQKIYHSPVFCIGKETSKLMCQKIDEAKQKKNTVGGVFEVIAQGMPLGLGSYAHWDRRLDAGLAQSVMGIPSVKAVEIGDGVSNAGKFGSQVHDQIYYSGSKGYFRLNNRAGGLEGGISNGQNLVVRGYAKPISTLLDPLDSVNVVSKKKIKAPYVRSDICFVPALSVVGECVVAWVVAEFFMEKFGGDSLLETRHNYQNYLKSLK